MRVLLISANQLTVPCPVFPLGLDYVAGALEAHHEVRVIDLCGVDDLAVIGEVAGSFEPDLVGISLRNIDNTESTDSRWFVDDYREAMAHVRVATRAPVVLGGAGFSVCPDGLLDYLGADFGIIGEGERLLDLVDCLERGEDPRGLSGLIVPGSKVMVPGPLDDRSGCSSLGTVSLDYYVANGGILNLQTKRGCPYRCVYCTYPGIEGHELRRFSPDEVGRRARSLQDAGARFLFMTDATFNCDPSHNLAVARALRGAGVETPWGAFFSPLPMPDGYYEELAQAGLTHVEFGTEAMSDPVLAAYRKPFRVKQVFEAHQQALDAGLWVAHYFMLGGPGESPWTPEETLTNADALEHTVCFFFCGVRIYPNTPLHRIAIEEGQVGEGASLLRPFFYQSELLQGLDPEEEVLRRAGGRINWIVGAGGQRTERLMQMMYARGHSGPLWEKLIR